MKRLFRYLVLVVMITAGCVKVEHPELLDPHSPIFRVSLDNSQTKTYVDENYSLFWHAEDRVSVFHKTTLNQEYIFSGSTGATSGNLIKADTENSGIGTPISANYAVYPYSQETLFLNGEKISVILPSVQYYAENSFGKGANPMVAVSSATDDMFLPFMNICGYLKLRLYGEEFRVRYITVNGNSGEKLSGRGIVSAEHLNPPAVEMASDAETGVTLDCGKEGILLGASEGDAVDFWIVLPPQEFSSGFTVTIIDHKGRSVMKSATGKVEIKRNRVKPMPAFDVNEESSDNAILYTTTNGAKLDISDEAFDVEIYSHTYENGIGRLTFKTPPQTIKEWAFSFQTRITTLSLPDGVRTIEQGAFSSCKNLVHITLPNTLESIVTSPNNPFRYCDKLERFYSKYASEDGRSIIIDGKFMCLAPANLFSYSIPEEVTAIGGYAFVECKGLKSVIIPEGVTSIENAAFFACTNLDTVICRPVTPPHLGSNPFLSNSSTRKIYVPTLSLQAYKTDEEWSEYADDIVGDLE